MRLRELQDEHRVWLAENFPDLRPYQAILGAVEEMGELAHAHLKQEQGISGTAEELEAAAKDAVADVVLFLSAYCISRGFDLEGILDATWAQVKQRDWKKYPRSGRPPREQGGERP